MRCLLDTHALLWWLFDDPKLSARAREAISEPQNEILVSAASAWEISTKHRLGKLPEAGDVAQRRSSRHRLPATCLAPIGTPLIAC
jgi:PIN domain nuclease of toxin-antitoxin system